MEGRCFKYYKRSKDFKRNKHQMIINVKRELLSSAGILFFLILISLQEFNYK